MSELQRLEAERDQARADLAAARQENERLTDAYQTAVDMRVDALEERDQARDLIDRQLGDCIGCNYDTGPEETCPHHGRSYTEWVEIASEVIGRNTEARREYAALQARIEALCVAVENRMMATAKPSEIRAAVAQPGEDDTRPRVTTPVSDVRASGGQLDGKP